MSENKTVPLTISTTESYSQFQQEFIERSSSLGIMVQSQKTGRIKNEKEEMYQGIKRIKYINQIEHTLVVWISGFVSS